MQRSNQKKRDEIIQRGRTWETLESMSFLISSFVCLKRSVETIAG